MNKEKQELHDKAWDLLDKKGLIMGEKMMIRSHFASMRKDEYPFIYMKCSKGNIENYHSEICAINNLIFESEQEVILANAIYENIKDNFNPNDFVQQLKYTFRILGIVNNWSK